MKTPAIPTVHKTAEFKVHIEKQKAYDLLMQLYSDLQNRCSQTNLPLLKINPTVFLDMAKIPGADLPADDEEETTHELLDSDSKKTLTRAEFMSLQTEDREFMILTNTLPAEYASLSREERRMYHMQRKREGKPNTVPVRIECVVKAWLPRYDDHALVSVVPNKYVYFDPSFIPPLIMNQDQRRGIDSLIDALLQEGIPEEALEKNSSLWDTIKNIERNKLISKNQGFYVSDSAGKEWLLKFTNNKERARIEAAANYYLSGQFEFILPGKVPEPICFNGVYATLQPSLRKKISIPRSTEYWLRCLAKFHDEAGRALNDAGIIIPDTNLRSAKQETERYANVLPITPRSFDGYLLEDAICRISSGQIAIIHNDIKSEHMIGKHLLDLEMLSKGNPFLDVGMLLIEKQVPLKKWSAYIQKYLGYRGIVGLSESEMRKIEKEAFCAAYVAASRELISSAFILPPGERRYCKQRRLESYLTEIKRSKIY